MRFWSILLGIMCMGINAWAGEIKAIVNDVPISAFDVEARAKMVMLQQAGQVGKLTESLKKRALNDLVDEKIKIQEMVKRGIQITSGEIEDALAHLERQNGLAKGGFKKVFEENKVPYQTLLDQTKANLGWLRILQQSGRLIAVSPADIQARREIIRQQLGRESVSFAEIVLPTEEEALAVWQRLQTGADFKTMVELHSIADSRTHGGRVVDVSYDYYGRDMADILSQMQVGQLSRPVAVPDGFAIILMMNKREAVTGETIKIWNLMQAVVPPDSVAATLLAEPVKNGCQTFEEIVKEEAVPGSFQRGQVSPAQLPSDIEPMLRNAAFKKVVGPLTTPAGLLFFMKCDEQEERVMPTDKQLALQIEAEKMELISNQILSELKRDVVIEYK